MSGKNQRVKDLERAVGAEVEITVTLLEAGETPAEGAGRVIHVTAESVRERMA